MSPLYRCLIVIILPNFDDHAKIHLKHNPYPRGHPNPPNPGTGNVKVSWKPLHHIYFYVLWHIKCYVSKDQMLFWILWKIFKTFEIPTIKPYIFLFCFFFLYYHLSKGIKCNNNNTPSFLWNRKRKLFLITVEIPTPKPYSFLLLVSLRIKVKPSLGPPMTFQN